MKIRLLVIGSLVALALNAHAEPPHHASPRPATPPKGKEAGLRAVGTHVVPNYNQPVHPTNNAPHQVTYHNASTNKDEHHPVVVDSRPAHVVDHDPHLRVIRRGYHSPRNWAHFHVARGGWWRAWGINAWDTVGVVTCEAANESTGEMYPVSQDRDDSGWDDDTINTILDQALDDCTADAGGAQCVPATPSCSFQHI